MQASALRCPACTTELSAVAAAGTPMLECRTCDGIWLDASQFEQICTSSESRAALLARPPGSRVTATERRIKYRPCVRCGKMMNRINFARLSGTIIDVCRGHGTFLDSGELHAIVTFIHGGGLERARQHDLRQLEDGKRRLESAQAALAHAQSHTVGSRGWDTSVALGIAEGSAGLTTAQGAGWSSIDP